MVLQMDAEFAASVAPLLPALQQMPKPEVHDVHTRRAILASFAKKSEVPADITQEIHHVDTPDGFKLPVWHLRRKEEVSQDSSGQGPAVLHIHGGGFISLSPEIMVAGLYDYVRQTGVQIFAVDYRLAPEHPYPTPLDDCWAALNWITSSADKLGVDKSRIGVMGESAGGGLSAGLTILARDRGLQPPIARQILGYPMIDDRNKDEVPQDVVTLWSSADNITGWTAYLGSRFGGDDVPVYAAPARVEDVSNLPPLYMDVGQLDIFVKDNNAYVSKFLAAGIETEFHIFPGLSHGFEGLAPSHSVAQLMREKRMQQFRKL